MSIHESFLTNAVKVAMSSMQSLIGDKNFSVIKFSPMRAARWQEFSHGENFHVFGNVYYNNNYEVGDTELIRIIIISVVIQLVPT